MGSNACYLCGKEGHYARSCPLNQNQNQNPQYPGRNNTSQLHAVQANLEGPSISQGRLEAPEPQARIYAYTKGDAEAGTSHVVTGQVSIATFDAIALFDSGATHSFISLDFAQRLGRGLNSLVQPFKTSLPSGEILWSDFWIRNAPVVMCGKELFVDLIAIKLQDFDVILGMDFLGKYNAKIDCRKRCVTFTPVGEEEFNFYGQSRSPTTRLVSAIRAWKMLANGCQGYLANIVDKDQETELTPENVARTSAFLLTPARTSAFA